MYQSQNPPRLSLLFHVYKTAKFWKYKLSKISSVNKPRAKYKARKQQIWAEISLYNLTQCSTRLVFVSADIISVKKKKVDKVYQWITFRKILCIFITYLYHSPSCQTAISLIMCSQLVSAFSALWCKPQAAVHSQPLAPGQWDTCQQEKNG